MFKNGEKRYEIRHLNDISPAHPDSLAAPASRPALGRPPTSAPSKVQSSTDAVPSSVPTPSNRFSSFPNPPPSNTKEESKQTLPAAVGNQTSASHATSILKNRVPPLTGPEPSRPVRSTRNKNPLYVDALSTDYQGPPAGHPFSRTATQRPWSASQAEIDWLNSQLPRARGP